MFGGFFRMTWFYVFLARKYLFTFNCNSYYISRQIEFLKLHLKFLLFELPSQAHWRINGWQLTHLTVPILSYSRTNFKMQIGLKQYNTQNWIFKPNVVETKDTTMRNKINFFSKYGKWTIYVFPIMALRISPILNFKYSFA